MVTNDRPMAYNINVIDKNVKFAHVRIRIVELFEKVTTDKLYKTKITN